MEKNEKKAIVDLCFDITVNVKGNIVYNPVSTEHITEYELNP